MDMSELSFDQMRSALNVWIGRQTMTPARRRDIAGLFEAVIERAEAAVTRAAAAEVEGARLRDENQEAWFAFDRQQSRGDRLAERVTELEQQLADAQAAYQWRPMTERPTRPAIYPVISDGGIIDAAIFTDRWHSNYPGNMAGWLLPPPWPDSYAEVERAAVEAAVAAARKHELRDALWYRTADEVIGWYEALPPGDKEIVAGIVREEAPPTVVRGYPQTSVEELVSYLAYVAANAAETENARQPWN